MPSVPIRSKQAHYRWSKWPGGQTQGESYEIIAILLLEMEGTLVTQLDVRKISRWLMVLISVSYAIYVLFERGWGDFFTILITGSVAFAFITYFKEMNK